MTRSAVCLGQSPLASVTAARLDSIGEAYPTQPSGAMLRNAPWRVKGTFRIRVVSLQGVGGGGGPLCIGNWSQTSDFLHNQNRGDFPVNTAACMHKS